MMKKYLYIATLLLSVLIFATPVFAQFSDTSNVPWAEDAINRLADQGIIQGMGNGKYEPIQDVTRGQFACIVVRAFNPVQRGINDFPDVKQGEYYYEAVQIARANGIIMGREDGKFYPNEKVSRQDMFVMTSRAIGSAYRGDLSFNDNDKISDYAIDAIKNMLPYIKGDEKNNIRPKDYANRAETAVFIDRVLNEQMQNEPTRAPSIKTEGSTFIRGEAAISAQHAKDWARTKGATQKFINAADNYWKYGAQMGIRADILYAQSAKETNYGKYTGMVTEDMNNFAGIKTANATGDEREDHETFATLDDGVRAHFNHMAAYVGIKPIGTPHARYHKVMSAAWAGTIVYTEELGGKWAPAYDYGSSVVDYMRAMHAFKFIPMNKNNKVVYLSPSKQFANTYSSGSTTEGEQMYLLAPMVKAELEAMGFKVYISDRSLSFQECGDEAYSVGAFAYVAMHTNASSAQLEGTECWYRGGDSRSQSLSQFIYDQVAPLSPGIEGVKNGLKDGIPRTLAEVRIPMMANCLLEIEYHDNPIFALWIINNKPEIAKKIAQGIANYWNTL